MESPNKPKKTQEQLLDERYGKGYSFGKKMQSGIPMPDESYDVGEYLVAKYPDLFCTNENGQVTRRTDN